MATPDIQVKVLIARPPADVRAWWLDLPEDYVATEPKEQPHRITTVARRPGQRDLLTHWRGPLGRELVVPETLIEHENGDWSFDITLPFGLAQRDDFHLTETPEGSQVVIDVRIWPRNALGHIMRPAFMAYARKWYAATWRNAGRLCERAAAP